LFFFVTAPTVCFVFFWQGGGGVLFFGFCLIPNNCLFFVLMGGALPIPQFPPGGSRVFCFSLFLSFFAPFFKPPGQVPCHKTPAPCDQNFFFFPFGSLGKHSWGVPAHFFVLGKVGPPTYLLSFRFWLFTGSFFLYQIFPPLVGRLVFSGGAFSPPTPIFFSGFFLGFRFPTKFFVGGVGVSRGACFYHMPHSTDCYPVLWGPLLVFAPILLVGGPFFLCALVLLCADFSPPVFFGCSPVLGEFG